MSDATFLERVAHIRAAFWEWDPIGVSDYRAANDDEYDHYVGRYLGRRADGASVEVAARDAAALLQCLTELDSVDPEHLVALLEAAERP
ncbi:hypothetical protein EV141_0871 [Microcella putealis]|uniref:Uncharacterized protein n=1 Tax=Microcella putealis TaxID=337005 RepID=A0A4Q7M0Y5_9MICO|nr:hypothetical protein [Microcella putealis]RZS59639.1 hypothetical protein EV141_0871 [Microcella putealis]TQM26752.1 hypothetical protein BJ957_0167 [Microcella putealis]